LAISYLTRPKVGRLMSGGASRLPLEGHVSVMYVYRDDGSDARKERVTAVSVIAGYEDWWQDLEEKWLARCGGGPFHAKDCESDWGDFAPQSPELADAKH
jgi:hypothetical protein